MTRSIQGIAAIALLALFAGSTPAAHAEGDKVTPVRSEKLPNVPGKSVTTVLVNYAPGGKSVSHHHAGSVMAYVLTGPDPLGELRNRTCQGLQGRRGVL